MIHGIPGSTLIQGVPQLIGEVILVCPNIFHESYLG